MGTADLKYQVPCQRMGMGGLPTSRPSWELGLQAGQAWGRVSHLPL